MLFYMLYVVFVFWHPLSTRNSATKEIFPVATIFGCRKPLWLHFASHHRGHFVKFFCQELPRIASDCHWDNYFERKSTRTVMKCLPSNREWLSSGVVKRDLFVKNRTYERSVVAYDNFDNLLFSPFQSLLFSFFLPLFLASFCLALCVVPKKP